MLITRGWLSDRSGFRGYYVIGFATLGLVGFVMCIATGNAGVGYAGVCESVYSKPRITLSIVIGASGIYPLIPLIVSWSANTMGGSLKRSIGMAM